MRRGDVDIVTEGTEPADEVRGGLGGVDAIEVRAVVHKNLPDEFD